MKKLINGHVKDYHEPYPAPPKKPQAHTLHTNQQPSSFPFKATEKKKKAHKTAPEEKKKRLIRDYWLAKKKKRKRKASNEVQNTKQKEAHTHTHKGCGWT